jgi:hypothetical protein
MPPWTCVIGFTNLIPQNTYPLNKIVVEDRKRKDSKKGKKGEDSIYILLQDKH